MAVLRLEADFEDTIPTGNDISSNWNTKRSSKTAECQTDRIRGTNRRLQTIPIAQTDIKSSVFAKLPDIKRGEYLRFVESGTQTEDVGGDVKGQEMTPEAEEFIRRVGSLMLSQLSIAMDSRAFDDYTVSWDDERDAITKLYALREPNANANAPAPIAMAKTAAPDSKRDSNTKSKANDTKSKGANAKVAIDTVSDAKAMGACSAVAFNSLGNIICVAMGRIDHSGWCMHRSFVAFYATNKLKVFNPNANANAPIALTKPNDAKSPANAGSAAIATAAAVRNALSTNGNTPDLEIETSCCVTCIAFHPEQATIVAVGLFNGEIFVYDIGRRSDGDDDDGDTANDDAAADDDDIQGDAIARKAAIEAKKKAAAAAAAAAAAGSTAAGGKGPTKSGSMLITGSGEPASVMNSTIDDYFHREPINKLVWVRDIQKDRLQWQLVSVAGDGRVLFWSEANKLSFPVYGCAVTPTPKYYGQSPAPSASGSGGGSKRNAYPILGASSVAFSPLDFSNFVVGTESGGVLKCLQSTRTIRRGVVKFGAYTYTADAHYLIESAGDKADVRRSVEKYAFTIGAGGTGGTANSKTDGKASTAAAAAAAAPKGDVKLDINHIFAAKPNPKSLYAQCSKFAFEPHSGPIYAIHFSPFHRHIFLSCSTDGTLHLRHLLQIKPLLTFQPSPAASAAYLFDVCWSPVRPLVFAVSDGAAALHIYDLTQSTVIPVRTEFIHSANSNASANVSSNAGAAGGGGSSASGVGSNANSNATSNGGASANPGSSVASASALVSLCFHPKDGSWLAAADQSGRAYVWQLSARLCTLQTDELATLNRLARIGQGEDADS